MISIALDWFQVHLSSTPPLIPSKLGEYDVKNLGKKGGFNAIYEFWKQGEAVATLAALPLDKSIMKQDSSFLKIHNKFLYQSDLKGMVTELITLIGAKFRNVSRVDIACDFEKFKNNLHPEVFIERFISRVPKYTKLRKAKCSMTWDHHRVNHYRYLRWGTPKSNVCYYLYDKTHEMKEVKDKPWIKEKWKQDNLTGDKNKWRLEFRIHSCSKGMVDPDAAHELKQYRKAKKLLRESKRHLTAAQVAELTDTIQFWEDNRADALADAKYFSTLEVLDNYQEIFRGLYHHFFDFRYNDGQAKKRRMKKIPLLEIEKPDKILMQIVEKLESNRTDKMLLKKLIFLNDELRKKTEIDYIPDDMIDRDSFLQSLESVMKYYSNSRDLTEWFAKKAEELKAQNFT